MNAAHVPLWAGGCFPGGLKGKLIMRAADSKKAPEATAFGVRMDVCFLKDMLDLFVPDAGNCTNQMFRIQ